ncbi:MAG: flagellar basal body-associated FliL family protein [Clostridiales bacterium]|nr:flagellar basal body-associated FliL family protein [Clostridiales bacterium]
MKKNIFSVIALAISIINLILTILIVFTLVPSAVKTNQLIAKVAENIDLEITSNPDFYTNNNMIPLTDIEVYNLEELTINLKPEPNDTRNHYTLVKIGLSINKEHPDYSKLRPKLETHQSYITEIVIEEFSKYSSSNIMDNIANIKEEILKRVQEKFESNFIVEVSTGKFLID